MYNTILCDILEAIKKWRPFPKLIRISQLLLMYCKSAICKSGQFEFDSVINWKSVLLFIAGK